MNDILLIFLFYALLGGIAHLALYNVSRVVGKMYVIHKNYLLVYSIILIVGFIIYKLC